MHMCVARPQWVNQIDQPGLYSPWLCIKRRDMWIATMTLVYYLHWWSGEHIRGEWRSNKWHWKDIKLVIHNTGLQWIYGGALYKAKALGKVYCSNKYLQWFLFGLWQSKVFGSYCLDMLSYHTGPRLNIKTVLSTYGDFHVKDKTAGRTSYL